MEYGMNVSRDFNEWSDRLWDLRDKRVDGWFMLDSFWPTFLLVAAYLFIVKIWGPRFMENRPAYNINTFLIITMLVKSASAHTFSYNSFEEDGVATTAFDVNRWIPRKLLKQC